MTQRCRQEVTARETQTRAAQPRHRRRNRHAHLCILGVGASEAIAPQATGGDNVKHMPGLPGNVLWHLQSLESRVVHLWRHLPISRPAAIAIRYN